MQFNNENVTLHPVARNDESRFEEHRAWVKQWAESDMYFLRSCVFIDESVFNTNMSPSTVRSTRDALVIFTTLLNKALSHSVLGAISPFGALNIGM